MNNGNRKILTLIGGLVGVALLVTAAVVLLFLFNKPDSPVSLVTPTTGSTATKGLPLFQQQCTICHPNDGKRPGNGPALTSSKIAASYPKFFEQLRQGKGLMPAFSSVQLSEADISNIYAYLQSIKS